VRIARTGASGFGANVPTTAAVAGLSFASRSVVNDPLMIWKSPPTYRFAPSWCSAYTVVSGLGAKARSRSPSAGFSLMRLGADCPLTPVQLPPANTLAPSVTTALTVPWGFGSKLVSTAPVVVSSSASRWVFPCAPMALKRPPA
jgi:hypothetical protein